MMSFGDMYNVCALLCIVSLMHDAILRVAYAD
jgi:hypothetical protein